MSDGEVAGIALQTLRNGGVYVVVSGRMRVTRFEAKGGVVGVVGVTDRNDEGQADKRDKDHVVMYRMLCPFVVIDAM